MNLGRLDGKVTEDGMHVEHAQRVADHENADGDHQHGACHRAEREIRTEPAKQRAQQSISDKFRDKKKQNGKCRICARLCLDFLLRMFFLVRGLLNIILLDLMRQRTCQQPPCTARQLKPPVVSPVIKATTAGSSVPESLVQIGRSGTWIEKEACRRQLLRNTTPSVTDDHRVNGMAFVLWTT